MKLDVKGQRGKIEVINVEGAARGMTAAKA